MAEMVANCVLGKLRDDSVKELMHRYRVYGVSRQIESLTRELAWFQAFLKDADSKNIVDERKKQWMKEVNDLVYWIEDVVENFLLDLPQKRYGKIEAFNGWLTKNKELTTVHRFSNEINKIRERIEEIRNYGVTNLDEGIEVEIGQSDPLETVLPDIDDAMNIVSSVQEKLRDAFLKGVLLQYGISEKVQKVSRALRWIGALLKEVNKKHIVGEVQKQLVKDVRDLGYYIQDVIDTFLLVVRQRMPGNINAFNRRFTEFKILPAVHQLVFKINKIEERIREIFENRERYEMINLGDSVAREIGQPVQQIVLPDVDDIERVMSSILEKLGELFVKEVLHQYGVCEQVLKVTRELSWIQAFLKDASTKSIEHPREKSLVKELTDLVQFTQKAIYTFLLKVPQKKPSTMETLKRRFTAIKILPALRRLVTEMNEFKVRNQAISDEFRYYQMSYNLGNDRQPVQQNVFLDDDADIVLVDDDGAAIIGFEEDKEKIVSLLLEEKPTSPFVISIVGTGGLGKTTLARKVYNSEAVKKHFDICIWVDLSQKSQLIDILRKIAKQLKIQPQIDVSEDLQLIEPINQFLKEKKYFLVLDDFWVSHNTWIEIEMPLPNINNGSKILITTRYLNVFEGAHPTMVSHKLQFLNEELSLQLLLEKALLNQNINEGHHNILYTICKQLLKKCGGLPLALVVLGDVLSKNFGNYAAWSKMAETMDWGRDGKPCTAIIGTSYDDLSTILKSCFMYFAAFPEDCEIDARSLLWMWIAEGFIPQHEYRATLEEIAESFLEDLVQRSMVEVSKRNFDGSIARCRIHPLMRALAIQKAKDDNFLMACSRVDDVKNCIQTHRLAINDSLWYTRTREDEKLYGEAIASASSNMRSLLSFRLMPNISQLMHLKLLCNTEWTPSVVYEPEKFGRLRQLRYVQFILEEIKKKDIDNFQKFIGGMKFLQTLDLRGGSICDLPDCVWHVETLRHVLLPTWPGFTSGPPPSINLINLQSLCGVTNRKSWVERGTPTLPNAKLLEIGPRDRFQWNTIVTLLGTINHLITLQIIGDDVPSNIIDISKFPFYRDLKNLDLWNEYETYQNKIDLKVGMFPIQLTTLRLKYLQFQQDPIPVLEKLENLRFLFLGGSKIEQLCCSAGGFNRLEELEFWKLEVLEEWKIEVGAMPMLKKLQLSHCPLLRVPHGLQNLSTLQDLTWYSRSQFHKISKTMVNEIHNICKHVPSIITPAVC
ncbi:hypothetical protein LUZ61_007929 [Rhynchospora tenuis]|uniref:NB-ARC domain-containing protein n=1 Tax=Rhynchospora tenuis TaxID=198213 RepID=A0AAD5ZUD1_9POAL|nr:hypothetical protein LUZ61_007929 [Rhynchospora tenuis]